MYNKLVARKLTLTFVVPVKNKELFKNNFIASHLFFEPNNFKI